MISNVPMGDLSDEQAFDLLDRVEALWTAADLLDDLGERVLPLLLRAHARRIEESLGVARSTCRGCGARACECSARLVDEIKGGAPVHLGDLDREGVA